MVLRLAAAAASLAAGAGPAWAQRGGYYGDTWGPHMMGGWMGGGWLGMLFGMVFWVVIIVAVIFGIRWLVQHTGSSGGGAAGPPDRALAILRERYAKGEIGKEEFESLKRDLES
jgi:putative membrane protein